jgi:hypothetical protein
MKNREIRYFWQECQVLDLRTCRSVRPPGAGGAASTTGNEECSLSHRLAEIVLVGLGMDQKTQVDAPQEQFLEAKLRKAFDEVSYSFEKILGEVRGDSNLVLAKQAVNQLQISLNQFENLLKEGGSTVKSCDSIKYLYQEIEHPLSELRRYFIKEPSEILTDKAAVVYVNALKASFRRLMDIAEEMDQGHSSIPTVGNGNNSRQAELPDTRRNRNHTSGNRVNQAPRTSPTR